MFDDLREIAAGTPATFHDVIRFRAARTPDAPAFLTEAAGALPYGAVLSAVDSIGASLNACGYGRNDRIAIIHPGGVDLATTILGIWSHATAVPLSSQLRLGELAVHIRDLRVDAVVIPEGMETPARAAAERIGVPVLDLDGTAAADAGALRLTGPRTDRAPTPGKARPDDIALVLMTSGTTSESKIVPFPHSLIVERCADGARLLALTAADRGANMMQLHHWGGIGSIIYTLYAGGSVAHFPGQDLRHIFRCLETLEPTFISGPYTVFHAMLAQQDRLGDAIRKIRPGLRMLRTGAGHLDTRVAEQLETLFGVPVIQAYGSSETAFMACDPFPPKQRKAGSVGRLGNSRLAIVDENGRPLPAGCEGEIIVSGPKVFEGYENNAAANAAAFIDGWFRVGDLGYFDKDGYLFLTGRIKEVINRGGQKIMPGEIDAAIMAHPAVAAAVAFPVPHQTLGDDIAAAVVLKPDAALNQKALADFLRARLGDAKVPRRLLFVHEIPKGTTGKIQRYKLAAAFGLDRTARSSDGHDRPATPTEAMLCRIWAETLQLPTVPTHEDFFALGGDSLMAVDLFLRIEEELGHRLPRSVLFEASTVAEMAERIDASAPARCLVPIRPAGRQPAFFCVHDVNGQVLNLRALAAHLGPDQPFYGIQSIGLDGAEKPLARIEDMAARYIAEIRSVQPVGPYHLGGYSMGGLIAYEMARQLREEGQAVRLLALFDSYPCDGNRRRHLSNWFEEGGNRLSNLKPSSVAHYVARGLLNLAQLGRTALRRRLFGAAWRICEICKMQMPVRLRRPVAANFLAIRLYRTEPYEGDAVLFAAGRYPWECDDALDGWRALIGGRLQIQAIPGMHHEILEEPHVRILARHLADRLGEEELRIRAPDDMAAAE